MYWQNAGEIPDPGCVAPQALAAKSLPDLGFFSVFSSSQLQVSDSLLHRHTVELGNNRLSTASHLTG